MHSLSPQKHRSSFSPQYTPLDILLQGLNQGLSSFSPESWKKALSRGAVPADKALPIALFRINHAGEIAAQGLYLGQALSTPSHSLRQDFIQAAQEESQHLQSCAQHVNRLGGRLSLLDPLWFVGSFCIGSVASLFGSAYSLGFLQETEEQVIRHFDQHIARLQAEDPSQEQHAVSIALLQKMQAEEAEHAAFAQAQGAAPLPWPIPTLMRWTAQIMTTLSARL